MIKSLLELCAAAFSRRNVTSDYEDAERKKLLTALNELTAELRSQQQKRSKSDLEVRAVDRQRLRVETRLLWATAIGVFAALGTLIFVWITTNATRDTAQAAVLGMRPIVLVSPQGRPGLAAQSDGRLHVFWNFVMRNYGPLPAIQFASRHGVFFGRDAETQVDQFFRELPDRLPAGPGLIEPTPKDESATHFDNAQSRKYTTEKEFLENLATIGSVKVAGRIEYRGIGGDYYRTDFCFHIAGSVGQCPKHYEISSLR